MAAWPDSRSTQRTHMTVATLVHLSDLHFGSRNQGAVWESLKRYLNESLCPDFILVTGDIVDSPSEVAFKAAKEQLSQLITKHKRRFLVCPGNHDRHWRGNATGRIGKALPFLKKANNSSAWFQKEFAGHIALLDHHEDLTFKVGSYEWRIRFAGIDTSDKAEYAAQGFVPLGDIDKLSRISNDPSTVDLDAVFLLMHHHLLPISANESSTQSVSGLIAGTTVLNAGTMLGALVKSQVNLVLHGHEHKRHIARYSTTGNWDGDTVILGAGSATGAVTLDACDHKQASANIIELHEDQSIWVKELHFDNGWTIKNEGRTCILPTIKIRQSKFHRGMSGDKPPPTSELIKHVRFTSERNALIQEKRSNWLIKGTEFGITARNLTGFPVNPRVSIDLPTGVSASELSTEGFESTSEVGQYVYRIGIAPSGPTLAKSVDISYEWIDGALLCKQDALLIEPAHRGPFRDKGLEFVALTVTSGLKSFQLHVHFPQGFWPETDNDNIKVFVQDIHKSKPPEERPNLKEHLTVTGPGILSLTVPYPTVGYRYIMAWKLPECIAETPMVLHLRRVLQARADEALSAFFDGLAQAPWKELVSVAVYLPERAINGKLVVNRVAFKSGQHAISDAPKRQISLAGHDEATYRHAWWDGTGIVYSQAGDAPDSQAILAGLLVGERWMFVLPVRAFNARPGAIPIALLRIGISAEIAQVGLNKPTDAGSFADHWERGLLLLLSLLYAAPVRIEER